MAKRLCILALFLNISFFIFGQTIEEFNSLVNFSVTLKELNAASSAGSIDALTDKFLIVSGAVATRKVVDPKKETYLGEIELINGEWVGVEQAIRYRCVLLLKGPEFAAAIPARRSRQANPAEILLNSRIMVLGKVIDLREYDDGSVVPVLQVFYIRFIN